MLMNLILQHSYQVELYATYGQYEMLTADVNCRVVDLSQLPGFFPGTKHRRDSNRQLWLPGDGILLYRLILFDLDS